MLFRSKGQIEALEEGDLHPENVAKIAKRLDVPEEEVVNMNRRLAGADSSLNAPVRNDDSDAEWQDWLADDAPDQETVLAESEELDDRRAMLNTALGQLTERERDILQSRQLRDEPLTLEELSAKYGISRERVRQIEVRAFEKLQEKMKLENARRLARKIGRAHV